MTVGKTCYIQYEPKGVVLHLATWNAPIADAFVPLSARLPPATPSC